MWASTSASRLAPERVLGPSDTDVLVGHPEHDSDAALALYNEANGHDIVWCAEHPPEPDAGATAWLDWEGQVKQIIDKYVATSDVCIASCVEEARRRLDPHRPLHACASCGARHLGEYHRVQVARLPNMFVMTKEQEHAYRSLGSVAFVEASGDDPHPPANADGLSSMQIFKRREAGLASLVSCYECEDRLYHLHRCLVAEPSSDPGADDDEGPTVMLCSRCHTTSHGNNETPPPFSLAKGYDFGNLSAMALPELSDVEKLLLSDVRLYGVVLKVVSPCSKENRPDAWLHDKLKGHFISFLHDGPNEVGKFVANTIRERKADFLKNVKVVLMGPKGSQDILAKRLLQCDQMKMRPTVVYNYLLLRNAIAHARFPFSRRGNRPVTAEAVQLPTPEEVVQVLQELQHELVQRARFTDDLRVEQHANRVDDVGAVRDFATEEVHIHRHTYRHTTPPMVAWCAVGVELGFTFKVRRKRQHPKLLPGRLCLLLPGDQQGDDRGVRRRC